MQSRLPGPPPWEEESIPAEARVGGRAAHTLTPWAGVPPPGPTWVHQRRASSLAQARGGGKLMTFESKALRTQARSSEVVLRLSSLS